MAFCLRPHDAFAARMKITMFTFREKERVCEQNCNGLKTFSLPWTILIQVRTRTTTKMGPAKLQMSVSWTESQQKSGFP